MRETGKLSEHVFAKCLCKESSLFDAIRFSGAWSSRVVFFAYPSSRLHLLAALLSIALAPEDPDRGKAPGEAMGPFFQSLTLGWRKGTPAKRYLFCWLVEHKGTPPNKKKTGTKTEPW